MAPHLSSLQRSQILALRATNIPLTQIAHQLHVSLSQVRYTVRQQTARVAPRSGRPRLLSPAQVDRVVAFVRGSPANQALPWAGIAPALGIECSVWAVRRALRLRGFSRGHALGRTLPAGDAPRGDQQDEHGREHPNQHLEHHLEQRQLPRLLCDQARAVQGQSQLRQGAIEGALREHAAQTAAMAAETGNPGAASQ
ncbi:hypothetical protein BROUX41_005300 [Berkeleyomyces rouxiae]|uniref:uncharacterized protein n=1 Tax=Berkeleyomyces rouxiae TaxID=2035830 RepID=UPI003B78D57E